MADNDMAEMMKALIEQNTAMIEMMKNQSETNESSGPWLKDQLKHNMVKKYKLPSSE